MARQQNPTSDPNGARTMHDGAAGWSVLAEDSARDALRAAVSRLDQAEAHGRPAERALAQIGVAACYRAVGAWSAAEDLLRQSLRQARLCDSTDLLVDVLCELAETACGLAVAVEQADRAGARAARDRARDEAFEAASLTPRIGDIDRRAAVLLHISDILNRCGDHDDAACLQGRAVALMAR